jgi:hypothetical protein
MARLNLEEYFFTVKKGRTNTQIAENKFICILFKDSVNISDKITSNYQMIS